MNDTINIGKLTNQAQLLVRVAIQIGWHATNMNSGGVTLFSHDNSQRILVPSTNINAAKIRSDLRKVMRYGEPVALALMKGHIDDIEGMTSKKYKPLMSLDMTAPLSIDGHEIPASWTASERAYERITPRPPVPKVLTPERNYIPTDTNSTLTLTDTYTERHVVSERPWIAKKVGHTEHAKGYESRAVIERIWSDGTKDYLCAGCRSYTNDRPRSVAVHFGASKDAKHPIVGQSEQLLETAPYEVKHRPPSERSERLLRELRAAMQAIRGKGYDLSSEDKMLEVLAEQMVRTRDESREDREEAGPLTPEQIIERVRRLVDGGAYLQQIERSNQMELQIEEANQRAALAEAKVAAMTRDVGALRELLSNVGTE